MVMSVVQVSTGFSYLSNAIYQYICNTPVHLTVNEIPDQSSNRLLLATSIYQPHGNVEYMYRHSHVIANYIIPYIT